MKQIVQHLGSGITEIIEVPLPSNQPGHLVIKTSHSLISSGTERMLVEFSRSNLLQKASQQPERLAEVLSKISTDGILPTFEAVTSKLNEPIPLGYCNVGEVVSVGSDVTEFSVGDRVVSNGSHAEYVTVPKNLCARIPPSVSSENASFTVLGSIALQGVRLVNPTLGECILVSGLGLIGILTAQILIANGCTVLGLDPSQANVRKAVDLGINAFLLRSDDEALSWIQTQSPIRAVDAVIVTASTTSSSPIHLAANACRQRGRIVLVGVTGLELRRDLFYKKELTFQVSCSYGPGRYDSQYEQEGFDYPIGHVRWTEQRNFQAFLSLLSRELVNVVPLISHSYSFQSSVAAYSLLTSDEPNLGILLTYDDSPDASDTIQVKKTIPKQTSSSVSIGVIGAGNYASRQLIPNFRNPSVCFHSLSATSGLRPSLLARRYGFRTVTTDTKALINDPAINTVVIASRHDSHADHSIEALQASKHVFLEKPLCLTYSELEAIESTYKDLTDKTGNSPRFMLGYNRRFSPLIQPVSDHLASVSEPLSIIYTINAGYIPPKHWTQNPKSGGGRLLGEACHFIDLVNFLARSPIESSSIQSLTSSSPCPDSFLVSLKYLSGSVASIFYYSNGAKQLPKEHLQIHFANRSIVIDNYRKLRSFNIPSLKSHTLFSQDKGHRNCANAFVSSILNPETPDLIPFDELISTQRLLLDLNSSLYRKST